MALTSDHLYLAKKCLSVYSKALNGENDKYFESLETGCQGIVFRDESRIVVCFRGSDSLTDWRMNFSMSLNNYPCTSNRMVHEGFLVQWLAVKQAVVCHIEEIMQVAEIKNVVFTGHSAGAAQSTIASSDLYDFCREKELGLELVTFGSPRVGNMEFKKDMESKIEKCTRIVLDRDVVTQAPLKVLGYEHVGRTIQIRDDIILEKEPTWLESLHWIVIGLPYVDLGARDHMPWNYVEEISRWLQMPK